MTEADPVDDATLLALLRQHPDGVSMPRLSQLLARQLGTRSEYDPLRRQLARLRGDGWVELKRVGHGRHRRSWWRLSKRS